MYWFLLKDKKTPNDDGGDDGGGDDIKTCPSTLKNFFKNKKFYIMSKNKYLTLNPIPYSGDHFYDDKKEATEFTCECENNKFKFYYFINDNKTLYDPGHKYLFDLYSTDNIKFNIYSSFEDKKWCWWKNDNTLLKTICLKEKPQTNNDFFTFIFI